MVDEVLDEKAKLHDILCRVVKVLSFYADPETYFAIGFFPDPPCGEFVDDFDEDYKHDDMSGPRPGKRAREMMVELGKECESVLDDNLWSLYVKDK